MGKVYETKTGKWAVDITIGGKRFRRVAGDSKKEAVTALKKLLDMQIASRKGKLFSDVGKELANSIKSIPRRENDY